MTHEEQYALADGLEFDRAHEAEAELRELATRAVDGIHPPGTYVGSELRFPVRGPRHPVGEARHLTRVWEARVDLAPGVRYSGDRNLKLAVVEAILRPQLREAGWKV